MAMIDDIFLVESVEGGVDGFKARTTVNAGHPIFVGHFPGSPIVPGVCLLRQVELLVEIHLGMPLQLVSVGNAKFINIVKADGPVPVLFNITIAPSAEADGYKVKATLSTSDELTVYARFSITYASLCGNTDIQ